MKRAAAELAVHGLVRVSLLLMTCAEHLARWTRTHSPTPTLDDLVREIAAEYRGMTSAGGEC